jgi:hypothetical protein
MANAEHRTILLQGTGAWNAWRKDHPDIVPDLGWADLQGSDLSRVNLARAHLRAANLQNAVLNSAVLWKADLAGARLDHAHLRQANLRKANLFDATLVGADLRGANLTGALLVDTNLQNADLTGAFVYGASVWMDSEELDGAIQRDLVIVDRHSSSNEWTPEAATESLLTVDDIELAQFIFLLQRNQKIKSLIDTMSSKVVLILGRFTRERKAVLDALKEKLRESNYVPVLFDFDKPDSKDLTETVGILASWSRFIIADLTDARSIPQELMRIVPTNPSVVVRPIGLSGHDDWTMFKDLLRFPWVLTPYRYDSLEELLASFEEQVVRPAIARAQEIEGRRQTIEKELATDLSHR